MTTYPTLDFSILKAGHDGPPIPESQLAYFKDRWRWRLFEFLLSRFEKEEANGLTQTKLSKRTGKSKEAINRWLSAPSNLEADTLSTLLLGIAGEEPTMDGLSLFNRPPSNYAPHTESEPTNKDSKSSLKPEEVEPSANRSANVSTFWPT